MDSASPTKNTTDTKQQSIFIAAHCESVRGSMTGKKTVYIENRRFSNRDTIFEAIDSFQAYSAAVLLVLEAQNGTFENLQSITSRDVRVAQRLAE